MLFCFFCPVLLQSSAIQSSALPNKIVNDMVKTGSSGGHVSSSWKYHQLEVSSAGSIIELEVQSEYQQCDFDLYNHCQCEKQAATGN